MTVKFLKSITNSVQFVREIVYYSKGITGDDRHQLVKYTSIVDNYSEYFVVNNITNRND